MNITIGLLFVCKNSHDMATGPDFLFLKKNACEFLGPILIGGPVGP